ncbi:hypothetical protein ACFPRL_34635 [Pseudoclavibacter helvolus]
MVIRRLADSFLGLAAEVLGSVLDLVVCTHLLFLSLPAADATGSPSPVTANGRSSVRPRGWFLSGGRSPTVASEPAMKM